MQTNERLRVVGNKVTDSYAIIKSSLITLHAKYEESKAEKNVIRRYALFKVRPSNDGETLEGDCGDRWTRMIARQTRASLMAGNLHAICIFPVMRCPLKSNSRFSPSHTEYDQGGDQAGHAVLGARGRAQAGEARTSRHLRAAMLHGPGEVERLAPRRQDGRRPQSRRRDPYPREEAT